MQRITITRALRAIRRRRRWSQRQLGARLGISKSEMSRWEAGALQNCTIEDLERWASALGARCIVDLQVDGERPMTDAYHARIQDWLVRLLRDAGWIAEPEASFNHYGDRGRIDVLAYHPGRRIVLVVEIKTRLVDAQGVLGRLDIKRRVAGQLAKDRGWPLRATVPALIIREGTTARRRIAAHAALFGQLDMRARAAMAWLKDPRTVVPSGVLAFVSLAR